MSPRFGLMCVGIVPHFGIILHWRRLWLDFEILTWYHTAMDIEKVKSKAAELAKKYNLDMIVLFGSHADSTATRESDVDIAYASKQPLSFEVELSLGNELASLFGTEAVDVVYLNRTSPAFMYQIMKKAKLLFSKNPMLFPDFFSYAIKRLHENMFLYDMKFNRLCQAYGI